MARCVGGVTINVETGPAMRCALDVLDLANEILARVNDEGLGELRTRTLTLYQVCTSSLHASRKTKDNDNN